MQLRVARLCLDCEEVHEANVCPACASETFAYVTRWIPAPERRQRARADAPEDPDDTVRVTPRPATPEDTVRMRPPRPAAPPRASAPSRGLLKKSVVGLTALGVAGWLFRRGSGGSRGDTEGR
jgi:hypothetical protein